MAQRISFPSLPSQSRSSVSSRTAVKNVDRTEWQQFFDKNSNSKSQTSKISRLFERGEKTKDFLSPAIQIHLDRLYEQIDDLARQLAEEQFQHQQTRANLDRIVRHEEKFLNEKCEKFRREQEEIFEKRFEDEKRKFSEFLEDEQRKTRQVEEKSKNDLNFVKYSFHVYKTSLDDEQMKQREEEKKSTFLSEENRSKKNSNELQTLQDELTLTKVELNQSKTRIFDLLKRLKTFEKNNKSSMQENDFIRLFDEVLSTNDAAERVSILERIQLGLSKILSANDLEKIHDKIRWNEIFHILRANSNDDVDRLLCAILDYFLVNLSIENLLNDFSSLLVDGLDERTNFSQRTKLFCLKALEKFSRSTRKENFFTMKTFFHHQQINTLLRLFLDNDQQILWLRSKEILEEFLREISQFDQNEILNDYLREEYFHPINRTILLSSKDRNEIVRLRLYEYLIDCSLINGEIYRHITEEQNLLEQFFLDATNHDEDILYVMNCLELLTSLTQKSHTVAFLQNKTNVIEHFFRLLVSNDEHGVIDLIKPAIIKFFSSFLRNYFLLLQSQTVDNEENQLLQRFLPFLFDLLLQTESTTYTMIGLDSIGFIGKTFHGKKMMLANEKFASFIEKLIQMIRSSQSEFRTRSLACLADLFHLTVDESSSPTGPMLTEEIYRLCNRVFSILPILIQIAKQPFVDLRLAAYHCLLELTRSPWALQAMNNEGGFLEFLLNRSTEKDKEGKEAKFGIIQSMCRDAERAKTIFGNVNFLKLRRYLNEGIFHVEPEANVAFDGSNE